MPNPVVHFEIGCRDSEATRKFFSSLFGWSINQVGPSGMIDTGKIDGHITALGHEPHNYVTVYVQVDDIEAYIAKAVALGGRKLVGPVKIPTGSFAWIADLDGNIIGLLANK